MIKILHFVSSPVIGSGVMSVIMNYYRHIDRKQFKFEFLCFIEPENQESSYQKEIEDLGGKLYYVKRPGTLGSVDELRRFFRKHQAEYAWLHNHEVYLTWLLRPLSRSCGVQNFIVHCHATAYSDKKIAALRNRILCFPIRYMKGIHRFACSKAAGEFLYGKEMVDAGKVFIMYNAIEPKKFAFSPNARKKIREQLNYEEKDIVLGNVGRLVPQKNQSFLLQLLKRLNEENTTNKRYKLLIIGEGVLKEKLQQEAVNFKIDSDVCFYGKTDDMADLLSAMDLFLLPSLFEGLPVSLVEAQANGLKCITSDVITREASENTIKSYPLDVDIWKMHINQENFVRTKQDDSKVLPEFYIDQAVKVLDREYKKQI